MKIRIFAIILLLLATIVPSHAQNRAMKDLLKEKYERQLKVLTTARDSLRVLYYLFDLSDRADQKELGWQIYETAGHAQDYNTQMDMLRNLAVFNYKNDSIINILQELADKIPNEEARASTKTFIFNQRVSYRTGFPEDEKKMAAMLLDSIVNSHNLQGKDVYDRIALMYQIIQYIGTEAEGSLFAEYLDRYSKLIEQLPESDFALKNQFYTTAAIFHSRLNGDQRRSVIYDKKLLEIMNSLQEMYIKKDRKHRNYDTNKFISYRRMLSNFKVLSDKEIDEIYDSITTIAARNADVKATIDKYGRINAYYYYAKGKYAEAIPYINQALEKGGVSVYYRLKFADMLIKASQAIGDQKTYVKGLEEYVHNSRIIDSLRGVTTERELMIRNGISNVPLLQVEESGKKKKQNTNERTLMITSGLLAAMLILYMVLYVRARRERKM